MDNPNKKVGIMQCCCTVWCKCGVVQCDVVQCSVVQCGVVCLLLSGVMSD